MLEKRAKRAMVMALVHPGHTARLGGIQSQSCKGGAMRCRHRSLLFAGLALFLVGCGEQATETTPSDASQPEATAEAAGSSEVGLPNLGGREVTIAVENAYLPFNYILADTGETAGWDYDAWAALCDLLNCRPVFVEAPWEGIIEKVAGGRTDTAGNGISVTEERRDIVDFSMPYVHIVQYLLVRNDEDRFETVEQFQADDSLMIGAQPDTTNHDTAIELVGEGRTLPYAQFSAAVRALLDGVVDAVVMDRIAGQGYVGPGADQLRFVDEILDRDSLAFVFPKGSDLRNPVNQGLAMLASDGTLKMLAGKYFSEEFDVTYDEIDFPEYQE